MERVLSVILGVNNYLARPMRFVYIILTSLIVHLAYVVSAYAWLGSYLPFRKYYLFSLFYEFPFVLLCVVLYYLLRRIKKLSRINEYALMGILSLVVLLVAVVFFHSEFTYNLNQTLFFLLQLSALGFLMVFINRLWPKTTQ